MDENSILPHRSCVTPDTPSIDSGEARTRGISVDFYNQSNTVHVNERYLNRIQNKFIVLIDDFTTEGYSCECARLLLLEAGAAAVLGINVGKYGSRYRVIAPRQGYSWDPCQAMQHENRSFFETVRFGQLDGNALTTITESYQGSICGEGERDCDWHDLRLYAISCREINRTYAA